MTMFPLLDIHTHDPARINSAIINITPDDEIIPGAIHSVGIHPWHTTKTTSEALSRLEALCSNPQVVAIGEAGLDALKGGDLNAQTELFTKQIELSETFQKPLIIHAVKTHQQIIALHKQMRPSQPWIIHGFRGKSQLAQTLLQQGFYISLGEKFNPDTATIIPDDRLLFESDESLLPIDVIISRIHSIRNAD